MTAERVEPFGYGIIFGDRKQHKCLVLERPIAEARAASLHGVWVRLYAEPRELDAVPTSLPA